MKKEDLDKLIYKANLVSIFIVSFSVISILLYAILFFYPTTKNEITVKLDYPINIDSTKIVEKINTNLQASYVKGDVKDTTKFKNISFNLNLETKDLSKINENNKLLYKSIDSMLVNFQRNQEILQSEKSERENFISFTSGILAIIIALSGFFGFKSINEMKNAAIESSREQAKIESRNISDSFVKEFIKTDLERITKNALTEVVSKYINPLEDRVGSLESDSEDKKEDKAPKKEKKPFNDEQV